ncbi:hypothetical protein RUM44_010669 [Polyplax serrata]|uniref:Prominin-like protein n=1 Tax=Polyplax serrata TaxID=468196 RepID=A0ABR1AMV4_POLSC
MYGLLVNSAGTLTVGDVEEHWQEWLLHYLPITVIAAIGLAFAVLMPIIGLFFCCCRCGGKCGAQPKHEKQHDSCKRTTLAIFLCGVCVIILFGVVCAFVTNEHMKEGIEELPKNMTTNLKDVELYLDNTEIETNHLLKTNFNELKVHWNIQIKDAGEIVKNQLAVVSHAVALTNLTNIVSGMEVIKQDLAAIQRATGHLQELASTLGDYLDVTRDELLKELYNCRDIPACRELLNHHQVAELKVVENFNGLPDVTHTFATISRLLGDQNSFDSIQRKVLEGQRNFNNIKYDISESLQTIVPEVDNAFKTIEKELATTSDKIKESLQAARELIGQSSTSLDTVNTFINDYAIYRYYLGLAVSGILLLILFCLTFGLLFGLCGKRPEQMYHDDGDCCNTTAGGRFLMLSVWLIFLLSTVLMIVCLAHFLVGMGADIFVCQPLKNPTSNKVFGLVDELIYLGNLNNQQKQDGNDLKLSEVLTSFHKNETIYKALKLKNLVDIDSVTKSIMDLLNDLKNLPRPNQFTNNIKLRTDQLELLTPDARAKLRELADSPLNDINFDKYTQLLNVQITNINLTQLSTQLRTNAQKIPDHATSGFDLTKIKKLLRAKARFLELLQRDSVAQIRQEIMILKSNVTTLKEHLKFNHTSLKDALESLISEVNRAQVYLRKNGTTELKALLDDFITQVVTNLEEYLNRVANKTKNNIGKSGPLSNVYNATVASACNRVMDPFNGFWVSVGWSVILFIPVIILSVKLSKLYTKSEAYGPPGMYGESEYLYDAYADRDNMPLAMTQVDKKKKNHHKNYQDNFENGGNSSYLQDYSEHLGRTDRASASNQTRYNDMAPKHWGDFPSARGASGGPPRYHHPSSTEYERPPPYYYPGP